jgi:hypothetical protein
MKCSDSGQPDQCENGDWCRTPRNEASGYLLGLLGQGFYEEGASGSISEIRFKFDEKEGPNPPIPDVQRVIQCIQKTANAMDHCVRFVISDHYVEANDSRFVEFCMCGVDPATKRNVSRDGKMAYDIMKTLADYGMDPTEFSEDIQEDLNLTRAEVRRMLDMDYLVECLAVYKKPDEPLSKKRKVHL